MGEFYSKGEAIPRKSSYIFVQIFVFDSAGSEELDLIEVGNFFL